MLLPDRLDHPRQDPTRNLVIIPTREEEMARSRGPVPKRSTERRRRNKPEGIPITSAPAAVAAVECPPADKDWHPIAHDWYESLAVSGQAQFYEPSDWAAAELVVIAIDTFVKKPSAMMLASIQSAMSNLLVTEGDRRRLRLELERVDPDADEGGDADVAWLDDARDRLRGGAG